MTFVSQGTSGPGIAPPEASVFAYGDPLSPLTPYDVFSSAPLVPGLPKTRSRTTIPKSS